MGNWQLVPMAEVQAGDLIEDPGSGAVWEVERVEPYAGDLLRVRAGAYAETGGPGEPCLVLRKADQ